MSETISVPRADLELMQNRLRQALRLLNQADADRLHATARHNRQRAAELIILCLVDNPGAPPPQRAKRMESAA